MKAQKLLQVGLFLAGLISLTWPAHSIFAQSARTDSASESLSRRAFEKLERALGRQLRVQWNADSGTPLFLSGGLTAPGFLALSTSSEAAALSFVQEHSSLFKIKNATEELKLIQNSGDELGMRHLRFQQTYNDLPVWGSELIVHFKKDGSIYSVNGRYLPTFDLSITPVLSNKAAETTAKTSITDAFGKTPNFDKIQSSLLVFPTKGQPRLAWLVALPNRVSPNSKCIVDALSGELLFVDTGIRN